VYRSLKFPAHPDVSYVQCARSPPAEWSVWSVEWSVVTDSFRTIHISDGHLICLISRVNFHWTVNRRLPSEVIRQSDMTGHCKTEREREKKLMNELFNATVAYLENPLFTRCSYSMIPLCIFIDKYDNIIVSELAVATNDCSVARSLKLRHVDLGYLDGWPPGKTGRCEPGSSVRT